jgi:uncharacterized protein
MSLLQALREFFAGDVPTPCVKQCGLDLERRLCAGCGRRPEEIARWDQLPVKQKRKILRELPARLDEGRAG